MQAPQVWPQPVRRQASSTPRPSLRIVRATSEKAQPAHSQRVMARGRSRGRGWKAALAIVLIEAGGY